MKASKPPKARRSKDQKRIPLSMRITPQIRERLVAGAEINGRSITQEAEFRLEQSFGQQSLFDEVLDLAYGPRVAAFLRLIGRILTDTGPHAAYKKTGKLETAINWISDAFAFDQAEKAVLLALEAFRPNGDKTPPPQPDEASRLGEMMARGVLIALKDRDCGGEIGEWARPIRERLGEIVEQIKVDPRELFMVNASPVQVVEGGRTIEGRIIDRNMGQSLLTDGTPKGRRRRNRAEGTAQEP